jgi:hypothetical protein
MTKNELETVIRSRRREIMDFADYFYGIQENNNLSDEDYMMNISEYICVKLEQLDLEEKLLDKVLKKETPQEDLEASN